MNQKTSVRVVGRHGLVWMCMVFWAPWILAQEVKDFSKGFEKFAALGIPSVKEAVYMQLEGGNNGMMSFRHHDSSSKLTMTGNAWLLEKKADGKHVFLGEGCQVTEVYDQELVQKEMLEKIQKATEGGKRQSQRELMALYQGADAKQGGKWKEADLAKDIKSLIDFLATPTNNNEQFKSQMDYGGGWGNYFLFAYQINQKGHAKEANQILNLLFQLSGDSRKVVQQAVNAVGGAQYSQIYGIFNRSHDWKEFETSLEALLVRTPTSWDETVLVKRLLAQVKKKSVMKDPPPIVGEGLTEEDQALARALVNPAKEDLGSLDQYHGFWILDGSGRRGMKDESVIGKIVARRVKAFPLLMALIKDDTLTAAGHYGMSYRGYRSYNYRSDDGQTEEEIEQQYESMARPITRGEIAKKLLGSIVSDDQGRVFENGGNPTDDLLKKSKEWYLKNGSKTDSEIIRSCLAEGSAAQKHAAISALLVSNKEEDSPMLEKYLLESKELRNELGFVSQYVAKRGPKAGGFLDQYILKAKAAPVPSGYEHLDEESRKSMDEQMEKSLAMMKELVSAKSAEVIFAEVMSRTNKWDYKTWNEIGFVLGRKLGGEKPSKALTLLLDGALKAQDDFLATQLLALAHQAKMLKQAMESELDEGDDPATLPVATPEETLKMETHREQWKKLLAIQRPVDSGQQGGQEQLTIGQYAGLIMEGLYGDEQQDGRMQMAVGRLGKRGWEIYRSRGEARLAGKTEAQLPVFPSADHVTTEQRAALQSRLGTLQGEALLKDVQALSLDEQLALEGIVATDATLNAKLSAIAGVVRTVKIDTDDTGLRQTVESYKGKTFSRKMVEELVEHSKRLLKEGKAVAIILNRAGCIQGSEISVQNPDLLAGMYKGYGSMAGRSGKQQSMLVVVAYGQGGETSVHATAFWMVDTVATAKSTDVVKTTKPTPPEPIKTTNDASKASTSVEVEKKPDDLLEKDVEESDYMAQSLEGQQKDLWEKVDALYDPKFNACGTSATTLVGIVADPKK